MTKWITLSCPTCAANLQVDGESNQFSCKHCGNNYLLKNKAQDTPPTEREQPRPLTTYTRHLNQWLRVGDYEICVHDVFEEPVQDERVIYVNVAYRNTSNKNLSCRRAQWVIFDVDGYTYDPESRNTLLEPFGRPPLSGERVIAIGMRVRGWLAYKIPKGCTIERLQFLTGYVSSKITEFLLAQP